MNKKIILFLAIFLALLIGAFVFLYPKFYRNQNGGSSELKKSYSTLEEYSAIINYSCDADSDCEIKDVRNCCGYYPECVNINAKVDPDFVNKACGEESMGSICGFPSIDACKCVNNKCQGYLSAEKINNLENSQLNKESLIESCQRTGGIWKEESDPCEPTCDYQRKKMKGEELGCITVTVPNCECEKDKCWNGSSCEPL